MKERYKLPCNIAQTLNLVGDRWTLLVIHEILIGHTTFNEIKKNLKGLSPNLLSDRLKFLEEAGLVQSTIYSEHPPRYEYRLTQSGKDLEDVFHALIIWGRNHLDKCYKKLVHTCDTEVQLQYYCPACDKVVSKDEIRAVELSDADSDSAPTSASTSDSATLATTEE
ncbi:MULTISPECIES: winged helix-turn-helix transcriptional regulator [Bacillaceae]|uniref:Helix-turn-helix transcriptional regulator n=1 Tax=Evansella alkalicola TaxID=745819 RepID=A0ABS6JV02_9BACI|nr:MULTISPECIES: helix-turn-helix domain-containing protein [Bacillaceae]MBU9722413.1 helix-turn-helix transcriptional regulator [Bacillus alkalicola]